MTLGEQAQEASFTVIDGGISPLAHIAQRLESGETILSNFLQVPNRPIHAACRLYPKVLKAGSYTGAC